MGRNVTGKKAKRRKVGSLVKNGIKNICGNESWKRNWERLTTY